MLKHSPQIAMNIAKATVPSLSNKCVTCADNTCVMKSKIITITSRAGLLALHLALYHWGGEGGALKGFCSQEEEILLGGDFTAGRCIFEC